MATRAEILKHLLQLDGSLPVLMERLRQFRWDSEKELIELRRTDIASVLNRYIRAELTATEIENWANAIEGRDDIGYEKEYGDLILSIVHELANPLITRSLSPQTAQELIVRLK